VDGVNESVLIPWYQPFPAAGKLRPQLLKTVLSIKSGVVIDGRMMPSLFYKRFSSGPVIM